MHIQQTSSRLPVRRRHNEEVSKAFMHLGFDFALKSVHRFLRCCSLSSVVSFYSLCVLMSTVNVNAEEKWFPSNFCISAIFLFFGLCIVQKLWWLLPSTGVSLEYFHECNASVSQFRTPSSANAQVVAFMRNKRKSKRRTKEKRKRLKKLRKNERKSNRDLNLAYVFCRSVFFAFTLFVFGIQQSHSWPGEITTSDSTSSRHSIVFDVIFIHSRKGEAKKAALIPFNVVFFSRPPPNGYLLHPPATLQREAIVKRMKRDGRWSGEEEKERMEKTHFTLHKINSKIRQSLLRTHGFAIKSFFSTWLSARSK